MNNPENNGKHLSAALLVRALDEEVSVAERLEVDRHLSVCEVCRCESDGLSSLSLAVESVVRMNAETSFSVGDTAWRRQRLQNALEDKAKALPVAATPGRVMWRFAWGMAVAATLAIGILLAPRNESSQAPVLEMAGALQATASPQTGSIEVDGESFTSLPYSNPDLPVSDERIVQMQVPVSSLADVGIVLEPVVSRVNRLEDSSVLADVLLGSDGQPRGVHVLGTEQ